MNVELLKKSGRIIFEHIAGSHLYGTNIATSDTDIRGVFIAPKEERDSLIEPIQEVSDSKEDIKYFELKKFMDLLTTANPNLLEMLYIPKDCVKFQTPIMDKLIENRHLFITKKAYHSHTGYAIAQIKKASGQNKMVNHPEMAIKPKKEDFCWIIEAPDRSQEYHSDMPFRPVPLKEKDLINLNEYHASALEHVPNTYRIYYYGKQAKGVFRGNDMLVCESIPFEDEWDRIGSLLIYNQHDYEKAMADYKKYNTWMENRNEARWIDQEKGLLTYDGKNMMHCLRLLLSGENILKNGEPIVRFEGEQLKYLKDIRAGKFTYEKLMADVEAKNKEIDTLYALTTLPHGVNIKQIDKLYKELINMNI